MSLADLRSALIEISETTATSLPEYTRRINIASRMYIDNDVASDPILRDVIDYAYQSYIALVMGASNVARFITGSETAKRMYNTVTTEDLKDPTDFNTAARLRMLFGLSSPNPTNGAPDVTTEAIKDHMEMQSVVPKEASSLAGGRVVTLSLNMKNKDDEDVHTTLDCWVRINPYFISPEVAREYVHLNSNLSFRRRFIQWRNEEIDFWKDLICTCDLVRRRRNALRNDRSGALNEMLKRHTEGFVRLMTKVIENEKTNIANTILVYQKSNFDKACTSAGFDFNDEKQREMFFARTFSMMCIVVDPYSNTVDVWMNGQSGKASYPYEAIKRASGKDKFDIIELMKTFQQSGNRF